jgi:hydrogenase maturation protein HypF
MSKERRRIAIQGVVQGVGFRPFVYGLAVNLGLTGWVVNSPQGVTIEAEGEANLLDLFAFRLQNELPPNASIDYFVSQLIPVLGESAFEIRRSEVSGAKTARILPDLATCPECLHDIYDPANRRYHYPFTNCTHCGPRFSIIQALPYDRANTTMRSFVMCPECRAEYENPLDRRFHAQPNACPKCGPQLALWDQDGKTLHKREEALLATAQALKTGKIVALKGLGGFQLLVDARNDEAVQRLRQRKGRYEKPFAVMYPALQEVESDCQITPAETRLLTSNAAPIVLLRYIGSQIAPAVAPENPYMGVMLPYTPLHHLLTAELSFPMVATSGNHSGEPILTDNEQALAELGEVADLFLVHDRPIARHVDDSVAYVFEEQMVTLRRARGYAPAPVPLEAAETAMVATGAQQKNVLAVAHHGKVILSQHLGDMENAAALDAFTRTRRDFEDLYELHPTAIVCDLHPDYTTTRMAEQSGLPLIRVQHHYAHVLSCIAEHGIDAPVLGVAWDGTGYGTDGTIWGGEFLRVGSDGFERVAHLAPFPLPGGELAAREPRRCALGVLYAMYGEDLPRDRLDFTPHELDLLIAALRKQINTPMTSSMGRLFDATAALAGLRQRCSFEGQAAMALEFAQDGINHDECYLFHITPVTRADRHIEYIIEWKGMIAALLGDTDSSAIAAKFHNTLAAMIVRIAQQIGEPKVVLSGGCFQNRALLDRAVKKLRSVGFHPFWQQHIPPNDGGIALGQIAAAIKEIQNVSGSTGKDRPHQR